jgi:predicted nucleic acid-binding Zn ribbon protein
MLLVDGGRQMAIYRYECSCGHIIETFGEAMCNWKRCPSCDKRAKRVIAPCNFVFKGEGFYSTDYRKKGEKGE